MEGGDIIEGLVLGGFMAYLDLQNRSQSQKGQYFKYFGSSGRVGAEGLGLAIRVIVIQLRWFLGPNNASFRV